MKLSLRHGLCRRDFVQWLGWAALALPGLELFESQASAQTAAKKSKYAVFIATVDGMYPPAFFPTGMDPTASPTLASLAPYKDKVLVLGPQLSANYPVTNTGLTYFPPTPQERMSICLTGSRVVLPLNPDQFHAVNKIDGPSIDYVIAQFLQNDPATKTPIPLLPLGIHPIGGDTPSDVTFDMAGNPQLRLSTADAVSRTVFGGMMPSPVGSPDAAAQLSKQTAITDFLNARFASLRAELGRFDQQRLDQHLSALRTYEARQTQLLQMRSTMPPSCSLPASAAMVPVDAASVGAGADTQFLSPFFMDTTAIAFSCNLTRVATIGFGYPGGGGAGGLRMPWLGFTDALHGVAQNGGNPVLVAKYAKMNGWIVTQVKYLMDQLAAIKTPAGTMLDETTIYLFNRHGDGNAHTNFGLPNVILGGTGGYFKMGQNLSLPQTNPTQVLISIAHAMGAAVTSFGSGPYADMNELAIIKA
jgi:hypothetical protein